MESPYLTFLNIMVSFIIEKRNEIEETDYI